MAEKIIVNLSSETEVKATVPDINYIPAYKVAEEQRRTNELERQAYYEEIQRKVANGEFNGEPGEKGEPGKDGTVTFEELSDEQKESLRGPQGETGPKGDKGDKGDKGETGSAGKNGTNGVGISSVTQTTTSTTDGGTNVITVTKTDGTTSTFSVKNGSKGSTGEKGAKGDKGDTGETGKNGADGKDGINGVGIFKVDVDENNHLKVTFSNGTTQDAGEIKVSGGSGSSGGFGEYKLIKDITITESDVAKETKAIAFSVDDNGNAFNLRAITVYCDFKGASDAGTFEIGIKNAGGALKGIYKRSEVLATSDRWVKLDMELNGYWTGGSTINTTVNGTAPTYVGHYRNAVTNSATYINLASNVVLPAGTRIQVFGVSV